MSVIYCEKHSRRWDSDFLEECPVCEIELATEGREVFQDAIKEKVLALFEWQGPTLESFMFPLKGLGEEVFVVVGTRKQIADLIQDKSN